MIKLKYSIIMGFMILFQNCGNSNFDREYFVGTWKANDGATIEIYKDGKCKAIGLNYYNIYSFEKYKNKNLNFEGFWNYSEKYENKLHISYLTGENFEYRGKTKQTKSSFDFELIGQGLFGNEPPYDLYIFIGDPDDIDESNKYRFVKQ